MVTHTHICANSNVIFYSAADCYNAGLLGICAIGKPTEADVACYDYPNYEYPAFPNEYHFHHWSDSGVECYVPGFDKKVGTGHIACVFEPDDARSVRNLARESSNGPSVASQT
ncbi:unnamed protein product [Zymoseptoria tritici ST99CH_3D7]|uniref:Uncharacterized protein n=1 Tax=Zymoseptoria tritici (strain ST99CH_3D7) TaxID=1276538 RepID=A0A1X7S742_ZYMT9|nr:unnamed protein product [Zymoseptoria tritici ST99CH_3D7]